ncbi:H-2 class II histocompatibility antigen, E-S beta chain-like [Chanos chanos]|uniref:H-2 class II histocompatibility antigen, E-S beta chain-like n=1 Tax=Chanos chanos TaxID=29144 RepID=A0A6J2V6F3_CHACN|nr:H-2 class II histocompatibility antigen, E-S beta chain-like [Chanos chanos]
MFQSKLLCVHFVVLISVFSKTDGYYEYQTHECVFSSRDLKDVEFVLSLVFNKFIYLQFNSTVGKFVGFNKFGQFNADLKNNNSAELQQWKGEVDRYCRHNDEIFFSAILEKAVPPKVHVRSLRKGSGTHPAMLMCSAYDFYPKQIQLTWLKDGKPMTSDVTSTEEMADGDWFYQVHSHLEHIPKSGEKISCMVEHASLTKPMIYDLESSVLESDTNKIAIGASGLVLGVILAAAGLIYYKKKATGRILVPH